MSEAQSAGTVERRRQGRRRILRTLLLAGGVLGAALSGFLPQAYARRLRLRPPGALEEHDFLSACIKCGQCVQVCPVQAIELADLVDGFGVGVPYIEPRAQACDFSCDVAQCILACPTGALTYHKPADMEVREGAKLASAPVLKDQPPGAVGRLNLEERMGIARLERPERCLAVRGQGFRGLARGERFEGLLRYEDEERWKPLPVAGHRYDVAACDLCVRECPIEGAISIETLTAADGTRRSQPVVHEPCIGCGVCEMICPVEPGCITIGAREGWTS